MIETPQVVDSPAQATAVIHLTIPRDQIRQVMGPGIKELMATVGAQGVKVTGPWFTHHLRPPGETFDFEIGVPVASTVTAAGRVKPGRLRGARVARTIYQGPYEGLAQAWGSLSEWMDKAGHRPADDLWEVYASGPESGDDPTAYRTELNRPLA